MYVHVYMILRIVVEIFSILHIPSYFLRLGTLRCVTYKYKFIYTFTFIDDDLKHQTSSSESDGEGVLNPFQHVQVYMV
jgi:hypothetical protein